MKGTEVEPFADHGQKGLRRGYTTGTCSAAAAKAAAAMLFSGMEVREVQMTVPAGETLLLEITDVMIGDGSVRCAVVKDAGDDPDVTNGMKVFAQLRRIPGGEIMIDGGEGVGRVTKPGLDQPPGSAAINSVPRQMIMQAVQEEIQRFGETGGIEVLISIPGGEEIAKRTLNPTLGIEGGLSVLGTSGIVEPMSEKALLDTIALSVRQRLALGDKVIIMAPGNYGLAFLQEQFSVPQECAVKIGNYIGDSLDIAVRETAAAETGGAAWDAGTAESGKPAVLLAGHIGKLVKVAGGIMNTHSRIADRRMEILGLHAQRCGAAQEVLRAVANCVTTEAALDVLAELGLLDAAMESVLQSIYEHVNERTGGAVQTEVILFSSVRGLLAQTAGAEELLRKAAETR